MLLHMSVVHLSTRRMYWSPRTRQDSVADVMTINRFEEILSVLHANDNELFMLKCASSLEIHMQSPSTPGIILVL